MRLPSIALYQIRYLRHTGLIDVAECTKLTIEWQVSINTSGSPLQLVWTQGKKDSCYVLTVVVKTLPSRFLLRVPLTPSYPFPYLVMLNRAASWMLLTAQMWISASYAGRSSPAVKSECRCRLLVDHLYIPVATPLLSTASSSYQQPSLSTLLTGRPTLLFLF
jgi:hypothetical protein